MPLICLRNHRILVYFSLQLVSLTAWALMLRVHCLVGVSDICFNFKTRLMGFVRNHPSMFSRLRPFLEHPQCWVMLFSCTAQPSDQTDVATHVPQTISNRCLTTVAWHLGGSTLCARAFSCLSCTCHETISARSSDHGSNHKGTDHCECDWLRSNLSRSFQIFVPFSCRTNIIYGCVTRTATSLPATHIGEFSFS